MIQSQSPKCKNNIFTKQKPLLKLSQTFETGLSDYRRVISIVTKSFSFKDPTRKNVYSSFRDFDVQKLSHLENDRHKRFDSAS